MKIIIVGGGIVGLTLAKKLLQVKRECEILIVDKFSIPSCESSKRNSGVLHAGLYYEPNSLKAVLCKSGRTQLRNYIQENDLPILNCGKFLIPEKESDINNMNKIYMNAKLNKCNVEIVGYDFASKIEEHIVEKESYLWSPDTCVFSPESILASLKKELLNNNRCQLLIDSVSRINDKEKTIMLKTNGNIKFDFLFNVCGGGALDLYERSSNRRNEFAMIPFQGEYCYIEDDIRLSTNLYPVPNPSLPFLGIHLTPTTDGRILIGPNAIPSLSSFSSQVGVDQVQSLTRRGLLLSSLLINNKHGFIKHAMKEIRIDKLRHFKKNASIFLNEVSGKSLAVKNTRKYDGIRSQLLCLRSLRLINDFICKKINTTLHVVNAVSPAFTSSFGLADYLIEKMELHK